jgi:hypothetical protein
MLPHDQGRAALTMLETWVAQALAMNSNSQ